jgi:hypothetical protein
MCRACTERTALLYDIVMVALDEAVKINPNLDNPFLIAKALAVAAQRHIAMAADIQAQALLEREVVLMIIQSPEDYNS